MATPIAYLKKIKEQNAEPRFSYFLSLNLNIKSLNSRPKNVEINL